MLLRLDGRGPLHRQLHRAIRGAVLDGRLTPGTRLPPTRTLAGELGLSRTVVVRAYERLRADGVLDSRVGSGTWVREVAHGPARTRTRQDPRTADRPPSPPVLSRWAEAAGSVWRPTPSPTPPRWDFRYGRIDPAGVPREAWRRSVRRALRRPSIEYAPPEGSEALRTALAAYLGRSRGVRCAPERILVVTGSQQALDLTARVLLDPGDAVVLEEPHYQGARQSFVAAGARVLLRPVDDEGIVLPAEGTAPGATDAGHQPPPRLAYVTPSHQFPAGGVLSLPRRLALLAWARRTGAWILEDDYDAEFRYDVPPVEAVQALDREGRVIYAGTFSKVLFPSLRLGYLVLPEALVEPFRTAKWLVDRHSPTLEQEALAHFVSEGSWDRHLRRMRRVHGRRRTALLEALDEELGGRVRVVGANAGVHVLAWLEGLDLTRLDDVVAAAHRREVGVYPITPYYAGTPPGAGLLLGYGVLEEDAIREGVRRLRAALDEVEASRGRRRRAERPAGRRALADGRSADVS